MPNAGQAELSRKKKLDEKSRSIKTKKAVFTHSTSTLSTTKKISNVKTQAKIVRPRGKENTEPNKSRLKANPAPDFTKLHNKWNNQFQKGKAVAKKTNTKVKPFVLTESSNHKSNIPQNDSNVDNDKPTEAKDLEDEFEIDDNALQGILRNTGIEVQESHEHQTLPTALQQSTQNTVSGFSTKRTSIYYMGTRRITISKPDAPREVLHNSKYVTTHLQSHNQDTSKQRKFDKITCGNQDGDDDDDEISFKPDAMALESILNNKGIENKPSWTSSRHTLASTRTMPFGSSKRQSSVFEEKSSKRTSIYYTGGKPSKATNDCVKPLPATLTMLGNRQDIATPSKLAQYTLGSTVVGYQDGEIHDKKVNDSNTFAKPITPARQQPKPLQEPVKPCLNQALITPSRGILDSRPQNAPSSCKKQVSWSDVLTPHRQQVNVSNKGSILKKPGHTQNASQQCRQTVQFASPVPSLTTASKDISLATNEALPNVDSPTVAMKLFSEDETTKEITNEKSEVEELEQQALEDLRLLEIEETKPTKAAGRLGTPTIDISGCIPLVSPPEMPNTPVTPHTSQDRSQNTLPQWIAATPQNHMRVTLRQKTPFNSPFVHFTEPVKPARLTTPTPIRTPLRTTSVVKNDVPFGLLSSIKKGASKRPCPPSSFHKSLLLGDTIYSSTPAVNMESPYAAPPELRDPFSGRSSDRGSVTNGNHTESRSVVDYHSNSNGAQNSVRSYSHIRFDPKSINEKNVLKNQESNVQFNEPVNTMSVGQHNAILKRRQTSTAFKPFHSNYRQNNLTATNGTIGGVKYGDNTLSDFQRNTSQFCSQYSRQNESNAGESLSLSSSLEHSQVKRVKRFAPYFGGSKTSQVVTPMKGVSLPKQPPTTLTEQALLDTETTLYSSLGSKNKIKSYRDLTNPLATLFTEGDSQHFVPICLCTETIRCPVHLTTHR